MKKHYLGDGVYVDIDEFGDIILTTENGICATNTIVMEPSVLDNFLEYVKRYNEEILKAIKGT